MKKTTNLSKYLLILTCLLTTSLLFSSCSRSDFEILGDVRNQIMFSYPKVTADVRNAIVTLSGEVESAEAKTDAEAKLTDIKGVKKINNNIEVVVPTPKLSADDILRTAITEGLKGIKLDEKVQVAIVNEEVTLSGKLPLVEQKKVKELMKTFKTKKVIDKMTK